MKNSKILITGISGFVGGGLAACFLKNGYKVFGLSRKKINNTKFKIYKNSYSSKDILDIIHKLKPDIIIHCAGSASVGNSIINPSEDFSGSVLLFQSLLEGVRISEKKPLIIFPSSAAVYGNQEKLPISEIAQLNPISPYGYHKLICELLAKEYSICYDIPIIAIRLFSLFPV